MESVQREISWISVDKFDFEFWFKNLPKLNYDSTLNSTRLSAKVKDVSFSLILALNRKIQTNRSLTLISESITEQFFTSNKNFCNTRNWFDQINSTVSNRINYLPIWRKRINIRMLSFRIEINSTYQKNNWTNRKQINSIW